MRSAEEPREPMDWTPEASRRARGFAVYAALRSLGCARRRGSRSIAAAGSRVALRIDCAGNPAIRILNDVVLNQVLVRVEPPAGDADAATRDVICGAFRRSASAGSAARAGTRWTRCGSRFRTGRRRKTDVDRSVESIIRAVRQGSIAEYEPTSLVAQRGRGIDRYALARGDGTGDDAGNG